MKTIPLQLNVVGGVIDDLYLGDKRSRRGTFCRFFVAWRDLVLLETCSGRMMNLLTLSW
jgi:hypothetical protein